MLLKEFFEEVDLKVYQRKIRNSFFLVCLSFYFFKDQTELRNIAEADQMLVDEDDEYSM